MKGVSKNPITELVGPYRRRPLRGYTFNYLTKIYAFYPHHNPFSNLGHFSGNDLEPKKNKEASLEVLSEGIEFNGSEKLVYEPGWTDRIESVVRFGANKNEAIDLNAMVSNVKKHLTGLEEILKNGLQQPVTDDRVDSLSVQNSLEIDDVDQDSMPVENNESHELFNEGNIKDDSVGENNKTKVEIKSLSSMGDGDSHAKVCPEIVIADISDSVNVERNETNFSSEGIPQDSSKVEGLASTSMRKEQEEGICQDSSKVEGLASTSMRKEQEEGSISAAKVIDTNKKKRKKETDDKGKSKKRKKDESKEAKVGISDPVVVEASSGGKSGDSHPTLVLGKVSKKIVRKEKPSARKVNKTCPGIWQIVQYTREQLLQLKQAAVPDNIMKAVRVISADFFDKNQKSASGDSISLDAGDSRKGQKGISADVKQAGEKLKDSDIVTKRKRGTSSEARKEKKKQKRRQKRTELNIKLGVKRLKLRPPVLKPKAVQPCRHYLKGRCHEGEKCKFSHDVVPLTKSKPCCHFARQTCMKGDDCPFDHQLSKYPCNNIVTTGYCIRGDACLFSHKVQDEEGLEKTVGVSKEVKCSDQSDKPTSKQHDSNLSLSGVETLKETSRTKTSQPMQAPKGLSFVSFRKSLLNNSVKPKELDSSPQIYDGAGTCHKLDQTQLGTTASPDNPPAHGASTSGSNIVETLPVSAAPSTSKEISLPSFNQPASGNNEKRKGTTETYNIKATQADSGQSSGRLGGSAEIISNSAQKALSSTLAFAAKYESGIKMSSAAVSATKEVDNKNKGTSSASGGIKNEATKASAILEFLFSSGNKQKQ